MQKEHQPYNIQPADRLANVSEYYFSRKLKEVAQMNAEGKNVIRDRKSTRLNSSHNRESRMPSSA